MCLSLRIPVATFQSDRSQSRAWKANVDEIRIVVGEPSLSPQKQALFDRFHDHQHQAKGWPRQTGRRRRRSSTIRFRPKSGATTSAIG
jgi:arginyl-tRNA--protein-N-Asp/Glu arginylyltransferase